VSETLSRNNVDERCGRVFSTVMLQGYCRVSTGEKNPDAQQDALIRAGVDPAHLYIDHTSGAKSSRPRWDELHRALRDGDVLVATRLDRVGRSTTHLVGLLDELGKRGVAFRFLEQGIDTITSEGRLMYRMLAAIAEFQRDLITANTREGLAAARARGRKGGRKPKLSRAQMQLAQQLYDDGEKTVAQIAAIFKVPRTTIYGHLDKQSVGTRPRAKRSHSERPEQETTSTSHASSPAPVTEMPRPVPARVIPPPKERSPEDRERMVRQRRRHTGPAIRALACPTCGHEPATRPEALQQREDLATVWLHRPDAGTPITEDTYCAHCQPSGTPTVLLSCVRCGDGPLLAGNLAEAVEARTDGQLPSALRAWLAEQGWQITPELLCPHDS
jgi:DNA invertase Pin-like site-specific DNA recombinase